VGSTRRAGQRRKEMISRRELSTLFGVPLNADYATINAAYSLLVLGLHPDKRRCTLESHVAFLRVGTQTLSFSLAAG